MRFTVDHVVLNVEYPEITAANARFAAHLQRLRAFKASRGH